MHARDIPDSLTLDVSVCGKQNKTDENTLIPPASIQTLLDPSLSLALILPLTHQTALFICYFFESIYTYLSTLYTQGGA